MKLVLIGAGGHGVSVADCAAESGQWREICFVDDRFPQIDRVLDWPVIGNIESISNDSDVFVAIGDNPTRLTLVERLMRSGLHLPSICHPRAIISSRARVGSGSIAMAGAIVNAATTIGPAVILNTGSSVDHNCVVEDGSHLSPGVTVGGGVTIGRGSWIGIGASVIHGVTVGKNVMIAAGSVVIEDIPDDTRVAGVPARPMQSRP